MSCMVCTRCKEQKPLSGFYKRKDSLSGFRSHCKVCTLAYTKSYANLNKKMKKASSRKYYLDNRDSILREHEKYRTNNKPKFAEYRTKRRCKEKQASVSWADKDIITDFYLEAEYFQMHVDHIVPIQHPLVCGLHCEFNMQLLTPTENKRKNNSFDPETFDNSQ